MMSFQDFLRARLANAGFTTEDALASFLPLMREVAAAHRADLVAPLVGNEDLKVEGVRIWFEEARRLPPALQGGKIRALDPPSVRAFEVLGEFKMTTDVDHGQESMVSLQIGQRGAEFTRPVYLSGYVCWEHEIGHHDPLTDIFSLGMILASLTCSLDFSDTEDLTQFVRHRRNLFDLNPNLHPVLTKAIVRMTELSRHRRPQDMPALLHTLENYRDQDIDFDFDPTRLQALKSADPRSKRQLILERLQQRLFEISRRNRLLHFRPTMQTVNLTWASVPLSFDVESIRPEQVLTWNNDFQQTVAAGKPIPLNKYLRFEEAIYLPSLLDQIRNEARRDQTEFGSAQLRLALCYFRWSNLKEKPPERFDSPLVLLPVELTKTKGVRDVYSLQPLSSDAEVNPVLRHYLKQLFAIDLPETVDLTTTPLETFHALLAAKIQSSEPGVTLEKVDRPRIHLIHARAQRRLELYRRRLKLSGRGIRSFLDLDYSYDRDNFHPLGLRLFQARIRPPETRLRALIEESPRPRTFIQPPLQSSSADRQKLLYTQAEEETNPYHWEFDLCSVTLGNFRYQRMSLVRDYAALLQNGTAHPSFDAILSLEPRPQAPAAQTAPPLEESFAIVLSDPTQASAVAQARSGQNLIIQGPPGTGKSQTITNLIADYVARGKRVLFVCEKRAAIDVVYHRLRQAGLHSLCCLIHDSQADKKDLILDLKQVYERLLETPEKQGAEPETIRKQLLAALVEDSAPLRQFHNAMRTAPASAKIPLRSLLHRAVELRQAMPEVSPQDEENLPNYSALEEHREGIVRAAATLEELQGPKSLADHPLKSLSARLVAEERPLDFTRERLARVEHLLDALETQLGELDVPGAEKQSGQQVSLLTRFAEEVSFLAAKNQLFLLRPESEHAKSFAKLQRDRRARERELEKAQEATKGWKHKLPPLETRIALEQARNFESGFLRFLKPAWWRLRGILNQRYDFGAHAVNPTWTQLLEQLEKEHGLLAALEEWEAESRVLFGYEGTFAQFADRVGAILESTKGLPAEFQALYRRLLDDSDGARIMLRLAQLKPLVDQLDQELAGLFEERSDSYSQLREQLALLEESLDELPDFLPLLKELAALPAPLTGAWRRFPWSLANLEAALARRTLHEVFRAERGLARFTNKVRKQQVRLLEQTWDQFHDANAAVVCDRVRRRFLEHVRIANLSHAQLTAEQKDFKTLYNRGRRELEHEFGKTMRFKSIRDLVAGNSGVVLQDLKPVWLMSPLSISDTLPLDATHFDVVIFDEASQVTLEEAVPSLFRAGQVIVVGDEMQLPPTNFFSAKHENDEEALVIKDADGQAVEYELGGQSFLNHAARNLPSTMLGWHYRSRSESLISFSNAAFYQGRLLTVPEVVLPAADAAAIQIRSAEEGSGIVPQLLDRPVSFHFLKHGIYQQRRNTAEADYIAHLVHGLLARETGLSIGIIAFSEAQQGEVQDALERLGRSDPAFRERLEAEMEREDEGQFVGLLIKNLENIQGDERDVVILSVCYGRAPSGKMLMTFGPINQNGGERRLNVAFSRAKQHMVLVSSIHHHEITNDYNDGARCLKNYLRYAEAMSQGAQAAARRVLGETGLQDSEPVCAAVADILLLELTTALRERGYEVASAVGQSSFRCDLAVRRPKDRAYRLGILVDSDEYYRQDDILARDVLKPKLLRAFGWKVSHVLIKDWFANRREVVNELERMITEESDDAANSQSVAEDAIASPALAVNLPGAAVSAPAACIEALESKAEAPLSAQTPGKALDAAGAPWQRSFEFIDGVSRKFWEISVHGIEHTVRFGRIGTAGQSRTKAFADAAAAERDALRLVSEKFAKGYVEKT
ncbi:MAG: WGR domain-containing protein [Planctomycetes bacterium]|nr:WGR domain-containing protein [Planctomycetota bacterium]